MSQVIHRSVVCSVLAVCGLASTCLAHEFWIQPSSFRVKVGEPLQVSLFVGDGFPGEAVARNPKHIVQFEALRREESTVEQPQIVPSSTPSIGTADSAASNQCDVNGSDSSASSTSEHASDEPVAQTKSPQATWKRSAITGRPGANPAGHVTLEQEGTTILVYRSGNSKVELPAEKFEKYLREDGMEGIIAMREQYGESAKPGRELFSRCCKSLIVAEKSEQDSSQAPVDHLVGLRHEIVLLGVEDADPATPGVSVRVLDMFDGASLPGAMVCVRSPEHPDEKVCVRTDNLGEAVLEVPWSGMLLVSAVHMTRAPEGYGAEWESAWASITFHQ